MDILRTIASYVQTQMNDMRKEISEDELQFIYLKEEQRLLKRTYIKEANSIDKESLRSVISLLESYAKSNEDIRAQLYGNVAEELKEIYKNREEVKKH